MFPIASLFLFLLNTNVFNTTLVFVFMGSAKRQWKGKLDNGYQIHSTANLEVYIFQ
jgi:hypothetical protein